MCLQEWIVKANSSSNISHCRAGTKIPNKSNTLDKPLICINCALFIPLVWTSKQCVKSCPTAPEFETATPKLENYLQGKENNIYQRDLNLRPRLS